MEEKKKRYTIKDIAAACGVSTATVSYVLNDVKNQAISEATRTRVMHYAHMIGYRSSSIARALATGVSNNIGIYMPYNGNACSKLQLVRALTAEAEAQGRNTVLLSDRCMKQWVGNVDAVLAIDISEDEFRVLGQNCFFPLLYLEGLIEDDLYYRFCFDARAIREKAQAISGRTQAVWIGDPPHSETYAAYLRQVFDGVYTPEEALRQPIPESAVPVAQDAVLGGMLRAAGRSCLNLGSEELPLDYAAYAARVMDTVLRTVARENVPEEHVQQI